MSYTVGQRWVSQTEPKLGLGIISEFENRRVTITFPAAGETRTYASQNAPISRVVYKAGDTITSHEDVDYLILDVDDSAEIINYIVEDKETEQHLDISEVELNCFIQFTSPLQRLISGHYDRNRAFRLRYETLQHKHRLQQSSINGLLGSRTNLLPHQVYIADTVAQRHAPRILLADEVGLGKTIEAGMILHAQLHNGLAKRALIIVPSTLVHQWLIEMLRRFNLSFSIFDRDRYDSLLEEGIDNPFETEQLVLCHQDFMLADDVKSSALDADWDLLVVDEAHHLHWSETQSSPEYQCIEDLAAQSHGVLLLTATPEQAGVESHFARLRLLDPDRFHSLSEFIEQEKNYQEISELVGTLQTLEEDAPLPEQVKSLLGEDAANISIADAIQQLLDQHGTGRILFRNTRQGVKGFPARVLQAHPLQADEPRQVDSFAEGDIKQNPKVGWLTQFLKQKKGEKVLIICASADTALALEAFLRLREGLRTAAFYEGLSIIERDRAAAYFADKEEGAQALICSEIGSEGRNFQFSHDLVLFDLPENPDLLEQRIGRLDRIGQTHDVQIHVPLLPGSRQEGLFNWYDQALDAFTHSCAAGYAIYEHFEAQLNDYLNAADYQSEQSQAFISQARAFRDDAMAALQSGRDPLLELNSCQPEKAADLIALIESEESSQELSAYMEKQFNLYGVEQEYQSDQTLIIRPGEHMLEQHFPGLKEEGNTLTFHRLKALVREDVEFVSWEHPMVNDLIDQTLSGELGNAALATMSVKGVEPGTLFLETIFALNSMAPKSLQLDKFLPVSPQRIVVNITGRDLSEVLPHEQLNELSKGIKRSMAHAVLKEIRNDIGTLLEHAQAIAEQAVPELIQQASTQMNQVLSDEIQRLVTLQAKNPLIRDEEIEALRHQQSACQDYIERTGLEVQAMRIVINT